MATAFQGVASKIGPGIIDDPLAAFEQIMKEKERRKKERRAAMESPPRRRSRSGERRRSMDRRSPRHNSSDSRDRGRSTGTFFILICIEYIVELKKTRQSLTYFMTLTNFFRLELIL